MRPETDEGQERQEFLDIFNELDEDANGYLDEHEFGDLLDALGVDYTPEALARGWREADRDHDGRIDFPDFIAWFERR